MASQNRRRAVGAEVGAEGVSFRVWAPAHRKVSVVFDDGREESLTAEDSGYFCGVMPARPGDLYRYRLGSDPKPYADPASRFQPEGPEGPSAVIDPDAYDWKDRGWKGVGDGPQIVYEFHVGTFTAEGSWNAAAERLPELADLGVTILEMMPVNDFAGEFGWGYDGVNLWAPTRLYGRPDDLRAFVDTAHGLGLAVILDVVYNHLGPSGNYLTKFSADYFTDRYLNEWGDPLNFDGPGSAPVREFFIENAGYWIEEFHFDGLRLDATQTINDLSEEHIVAAIRRRIRQAAGGRRTWSVSENEPQHIRLVEALDRGGCGLEAMWNDDFHHSARVALTGKREAYFTDYFGRAQEFVSMAKHGFLYQGQHYRWQKKRRGSVSIGWPPQTFVACLQNHDQVANSGSGQRLQELASAPAIRAMTALLLLGPQTPMIFQGEEWGTTTRFTYFADHEPELAKLVEKGRREFMLQFPSLSDIEETIPPPADRATFEACKLDWEKRDARWLALHRDLIALRKNDRTLIAAQRDSRRVDGAVLNDRAFLLRYFDGGDDRLLVVNLGALLDLEILSEPLCAAPPGKRWELAWSSEAAQYGGSGSGPLFQEEGGWRIAPSVALLLRAVSSDEPDDQLKPQNPRPG
jgi:maltooligosyltrehalose trehalohydrolase